MAIAHNRQPQTRHFADRGNRALFSRSEASVEERSSARQDSRDVTERLLRYLWRGARPACGCVRGPGSAWSAAARFTFWSATFSSSRPRRARARGRAPRAAQGLFRRPSVRHGGGSRWSCSWLVSARTRSPSSSRRCSGLPTRKARPAGGVSVRCRRGELLYSAFCLTTARLLVGSPPKQTAQSEQRQGST